MNLRRYQLLGIVVVFAIGVVAGLVIFGTQPNPVRHAGGLTVPGNTVTFAAVDNSGQFGTITVTRRGERAVRADEQQQVAVTGGAMSVVEVEIAYAPVHASDTGFGTFDWWVWVDGALNPGGFPDVFPTIANGNASLGNELPGHAEPRAGILGVQIPPSAAGKAVFLVYIAGIQPLPDNPFDRKSTTRVQVWGP